MQVQVIAVVPSLRDVLVTVAVVVNDNNNDDDDVDGDNCTEQKTELNCTRQLQDFFNSACSQAEKKIKSDTL